MKVKTMAYAMVAACFMVSTVDAKVAVLQHDYRTLAGKERINLQKAYGGKVVLVVNTASKCGFTPQFEALEAIYAKYQAQGFVVLGFPSNDFMGQDPGSEKEIKEFCTLTYGVKFPMFEKVHVKGLDATAIYRDFKELTGDVPAWNFHKFLIDRNGEVIGSFSSKVKPDDAQITSKIEAALAAK